MIDIILIVIAVMFGTLLYDKNKRGKFIPILKECFNGDLNPCPKTNEFQTTTAANLVSNRKQWTTENLLPSMPGKVEFDRRATVLHDIFSDQSVTPSYKSFLNSESDKNKFRPCSLCKNTYQHMDFDNNIASIYGYKSERYDTTPRNTVLTCTENDGFMGKNRWCGCEALSSNGTTETATKRLIGDVNPRTLIAPYIIPPITDMEEWGTDNYTIHSATNNYRSDELFLSGYVTLDNCKCKGMCNCSRKWNKPLIENFNEDVLNHPIDTTNISGTLGPLTTRVNSSCRGTLLNDCGGENLSQVVADHNFISPYDVSEQRLTRPQIIQNYGISRVPDKQIYTSITNGDDLIFAEQRKRYGKNEPFFEDYITGDEPSMIYDPRMVGYSDSKRGYVDKLLGQPKFYYDDINAARAPNYITRNKIDIYSFGETTGRLQDPRDLGTCGDNNQLAVEEFHNSALQHRADLMQSLMNKRNGEMWQLREFPINTNGQRMLGGTSKI